MLDFNHDNRMNDVVAVTELWFLRKAGMAVFNLFSWFPDKIERG